ncbi:TIGR00730 family Rossman fold protein [Rhodoligotrophos defluvii]|uniref:LOG family protein n=1 Tax=Rhodoligotrophos defluvii TaxID=2561934 RepID=UPI0010C9D36F|nr:TIGR00730 family Rossman fold protein [Rhodoligotrophos defluvii]
MPSIHSVCVYCGSNPGRSPIYTEEARVLGAELARNGIRLVYGGGGMGLMGEVARATLAGGGEVTGIIPSFLIQKERMLAEVNDLVITQNMHERKMTMFERSDAFVALPGGIGTLEELVEISTWFQLGQHSKPIVLVNSAGFWVPLLELVEHMRREGFIRPGLDVALYVVDKAADVVPYLLEVGARQRETVPVRPTRQRM